MAAVYDQDGNPIGAVIGHHQPHRYVEQLGNCATCGKNRWHAEHFNGDGAAAALAMETERQNAAQRNEFVRNLKVGDAVVVADDHPSSDLQGATGNVTAIENQGDNKPKIVTVKFRHRQVAVKSQWLRAVPLPEPPPPFQSVEEADQWLEDTAREMGIKVEPDVPRFGSPEEADEWMRRQQGEPYVPPSWQDDGSLDPRDSGDKWADRLLQELLQKSIKPGEPIVTTSLTRAGLRQAIKGAQMKGMYLDEAADFTSATDDDVIDPYA